MRKLIKPSKAADMLGLSRSSVYRWYWEGKLKGVKLKGGPIRIYEISVLEQLEDGDYTSNSLEDVSQWLS